MLERFRFAWAAFLTPLAKLLLKLKVTPDMVTIVGTLGVTIASLTLFPLGLLWPGAVIVGILVITDSIDGQMAKLGGHPSRWGAFLDSSLDRLGDGAVFGGILLYLAGHADSLIWSGIALWALVWGQVTSYVKARAESVGFSADVGIAARADRLVVILLAAFIAGFGIPYVLEIAVSVLAVASTITVLQRIVIVYKQAKADPDPAEHVEPA